MIYDFNGNECNASDYLYATDTLCVSTMVHKCGVARLLEGGGEEKNASDPGTFVTL